MRKGTHPHTISVTTDIGGMEVSDYGWDDQKAAINRKKHKVGFEEAIEVFKESPVLYFGEDTSENYGEKRLCAAGITRKNRLLFIVFEEVEEENGSEFIHIIHAKELERSHFKHFENPNDRRELTTLLESFQGSRNDRG